MCSLERQTPQPRQQARLQSQPALRSPPQLWQAQRQQLLPIRRILLPVQQRPLLPQRQQQQQQPQGAMQHQRAAQVTHHLRLRQQHQPLTHQQGRRLALRQALWSC